MDKINATIQERADKYIQEMDCSEWTDVEDYARHGYEQGATDEHALLTKWHDPKDQLPDDSRAVLVKAKRYSEGNHPEFYAVMFYNNGVWQFVTRPIQRMDRIVICWREIE